jgi:hypothetical protein
VQDFDGSSLPATFTAGPPWTSGGAATVADGSVAVDGTPMRSTATYGPGTSVEILATFAASTSEHVGFGTDLDTQPWAMFSTRGTTDTIYAAFHANPMYHSSTFGNNPLAATAASKAIEITVRDRLPERSATWTTAWWRRTP